MLSLPYPRAMNDQTFKVMTSQCPYQSIHLLKHFPESNKCTYIETWCNLPKSNNLSHVNIDVAHTIKKIKIKKKEIKVNGRILNTNRKVSMWKQNLYCVRYNILEEERRLLCMNRMVETTGWTKWEERGNDVWGGKRLQSKF